MDLHTKEGQSIRILEKGDEPYYPMNDEKNNMLYSKYKELASKEKNVIFGGRLGMYKYFDMHNVVAEALQCVRNELQCSPDIRHNML